ncbi:MAG: 4Fe-4S binding protein [Candidatus Kapabacteria bacterium]|nr:4Fe-4S binding protein [Candidatus Kapabacteria bacterium]
MMIEVITARCPQNHPCPAVHRCPVDAIVQNGYAAPSVDSDKCTDCGQCTYMCRAFTEQ